MSDKPRQFGEKAGLRINMTHEGECRYWCGALGLSPDQLREAVQEVGPMVSKIRRLLRSRIKQGQRESADS